MKLLGIGHIVMDHLVRLEHWPAPDSKQVALEGVECLGGPVARACITASLLGVETSFIGRVGSDPTASALKDELLAAGVRPLLEPVKGRSARASIWVESRNGQRTVVLDRAGLPDLDAADLHAVRPEHAGMLLHDGKEAQALHLAKAVRAAGGRVMLDLGSARENPYPMIAASDILVVSKSFMLAHEPDADMLEGARRLRDLGPRLVIITLGPGGCIANEAGDSFWFPAWTPPRIVDTTGAGDVYHGALAWSILRGDETRTSLALAAVAAGLACTTLGSRMASLDADRLETLRADSSWPV